MFWFVCFPPISLILYFRQKRPSFLKQGGERGGEHTNSKLFLENRQSKNFCLAYFSKLNRDPVEKKLYCFEDPHCNRGGGKKGRLEFPRIRHDVSLGFDIRYGPHSSFYRGAFVHCMPFDGASHRSVQCFFLKGCFVIRNRPSGGSADICVYPTGDFNVGCLKLLFLKF